MTTFRDILAIAITADGKRAVREIEGVGRAARRDLGRAGTAADQMSRRFTIAGVGMVASASVIGAGLFKAATAASEAELAQKKLANTIANMPRLAGASIGAFQAQQKALEHTTVASDEAVASIQALLGQFGMTQSQVIALTPLVVDLSRKMGKEFPVVAAAVGKAFGGSATALQRMGVQIHLSSDPTKRYVQLLEQLRQKAGGFAAAEGKTFTGQLGIAKNELHDVAEAIGRGATPALIGMLKPIQGLAEGFAGLSKGTQEGIGRFAAYGTVALAVAGVTSVVVGRIISLGSAIRSGAQTVQRLVERFTAVRTAAGAAAEAETEMAVASDDAAAAAAGEAAAVDSLAVAYEDVAAAAVAAGAAEAEAMAATEGLAAAAAGAAAAEEGLAAAEETAAAAAGVLNASMGAFGLGLAAVAAIGAGIAMIAANADDSAQAVAKLRDEMEATGQSAQDIARVDFAKKLAGEMGQQEVLRLARVSYAQLWDAIASGGPKLDRVRDKLKTVYETMIRNPTAETAGKTEMLYNSYQDLSDSVDNTRKSILDATRADAERKTILDATGTAVADAAIAEGSMTEALNRQRDAANNAITALNNLMEAHKKTRDSERGAAGAVLNYQDALQNVTDKTKAYNDAVKQNGKASDEAKSAYRDLIQATFDVGGSFDEARSKITAAGDAVKGNKTETKLFVDNLNLVKATLDPNGELARWIDAYIAKLNNIPTTVATTVRLDSKGNVKVGNFGGPNADGGPVAAGIPYLVGEKGPEIFMPSQAGRIITNYNLRHAGGYSVSGGDGGGNNYTITVQSLDAKSAATAVVDALKHYERTRGGIPVRLRT